MIAPVKIVQLAENEEEPDGVMATGYLTRQCVGLYWMCQLDMLDQTNRQWLLSPEES